MIVGSVGLDNFEYAFSWNFGKRELKEYTYILYIIGTLRILKTYIIVRE